MDCLVLSSSILKWCSLDYDYIGAPLFKDNDKPEKGVSFGGNGGLSLRRVSGFLNVLNSKNITPIGDKNIIQERYWMNL